MGGTGDLQTLAVVMAAARDLTVAGCMLVFIVGGFKRWWVWGHHYRELKTQCESETAERKLTENEANRKIEWWQNYALGLRETAHLAVGTAESAVHQLTTVPPRGGR